MDLFVVDDQSGLQEFRKKIQDYEGVITIAAHCVTVRDAKETAHFLSRLKYGKLLKAVLFMEPAAAEEVESFLRFTPGMNARIAAKPAAPERITSELAALREETVRYDSYQSAQGGNELAGVANLMKDAAEAYDRSLLFESLMDNLPNHIYFKDLDSRFMLVNKAMANWVDCTPEKLAGKTDADIFNSVHANEAREDELSIISGSQSRVLKEEREEHLDGHVTWVSTTKLPLYSIQGELIGTFGISKDITARKNAEIQLEKERNLLRTLVDMLPFRIFVKNRDGEYLLSNMTHRKLLGVKSEDELQGKKLTDYFAGENGQHSMSLDREVLDRGVKLLNREEPDMLNPAPDSWILSNRVPLRDFEGNVIGLVGASMDISKRKRAEIKLQEYHEQLEDDLEMAKSVQMSLLPAGHIQDEVTLCRSHEKFTFAYSYLPCEALAGDFLQMISLDDNKVGILVADVMGHGVRAALITALMTGIVDELLTWAESPAEFMTRLNSRISAVIQQNASFVFISACYLVADTGTERLRWVSAGHPYPFIIRNGMVTPLGGKDLAPQPALNVSPGHSYREEVSSWDCNTRLFAYSDGITEAKNAAGEEYSAEVLQKVLQNTDDVDACGILTSVLASVRKFSNSESLDDDICLVLLESFRDITP